MRRLTGILLLTLTLAAGCKVTEQDIDTWMGTVKGPGKIVAVLLADKYGDPLRVHAGLALVRMDPREDVDGVTELQAALGRLPEETRARVVDAMVPSLLEMMRGEDVADAAADGDTTPHRQIRAKDATFLLIPYASDAQRGEMINGVVDWFTVDFNGRSLSGNFSAEQVVRQLGAPAASRLVNAMTAQLPTPQAIVKICELIGSLGSDETKTRAAERMVAIEAEMNSDGFRDWLAGRLREQLRARNAEAAGEGEEPAPINEERVLAAAELNRKNYVSLGALPAMKHLNSQTAVQNRLVEIAQTAEFAGLSAEEANERRVKALQALEGGVRADHVDPLLTLALAEATPARVSDYAFDRVSDSQNAAVIPRLWPVFSATEDWRMRWRVGSIILTLGGADVITQFFAQLDDPNYAREELSGYGERLSQIRPAPDQIIDQKLRSSRWYDRCIALFYLERRAEADDLPRIQALVSDGASVAGPPSESGRSWQEQNTVGKVAEAVAGAIRARLERDERAAAAGQNAEQAEEEQEETAEAAE